MKKVLIALALVALLSGSASAGPIDWMMRQFGYTPTAEIIKQRQKAEIENLKLKAQIAELQVLQKQIEATARMRLYFLISILSSVAFGLYWQQRENIKSVWAGIRKRGEKMFGKKEIPARSGNEMTN